MIHPHRRPFAVHCLPFLALALAVLPAASPYFIAGLPRTNDALPHLYRALALDRLVRAGILWPRWSPDLVHGYGYPVFNFFPVLSHYLVVVGHLTGLPLTTAYRAAILIQFVLAAWFAYLLARDLFGPAGGWAAALAYVYSPYFLYDAIVRAGLPESQALAFFPLLLFALRRAALHGGRWIAVSALAFAAIFLSHFPIAVQLCIPIGLMLVWLGWQAGWKNLWKPLAGLALGVLLTAMFWLPTLSEVQHVRTSLSISQGYGYQDNFMALRELLAWPRLPADPALVNPPVVRALPQVTLALAAIGLIWRWRRLSRATRWQAGLWAGILAVCTALITPLSRFVWDRVALLNQTLYPWRFLGPASLAGALLLAAAFASHSSPLPKRERAFLSLLGREARGEGWALALVTLLIVIAAIPWLYPPREPVPETPTIADMVAFEQPPLFVGTTTLGEFLPRWIAELPDTSELAARLAAGESPDRLAVPDGVTARLLRGSALDATYRIQADVPATLTYRQFYFPGWQATLDGAPLPVYPSQPNGLTLLDVPAGEHTLRVRFGTTPPRTIGWVLSSLGALLTLAILARPFSRSQPTNHLASQPTDRLSNPYWLLALAALVLLIKLFFDKVDTPLRRPTLELQGLRGVQHPVAMDFASELLLLGYDLTPARGVLGGGIPADSNVELILYWRPLHAIGVVYVPVLHVVDENGLAWDAGTTRPHDWRFAPGTDFWPPDGYVMDPYVLRLADGTPPGQYAFRVSLVRRDTGQTVAEHDIGSLTVARPARGERPLEEGMTPALGTYTRGGLRLLGSRTDRVEAAPGDPMRVTLLWLVTGPVSGDGQVVLRLAEADGTAILTTTVPITLHYPPGQWQPGDRLRSEALLRLPASVPDGEHTWQVQLGPAAPSWPVGTLRVHAPQRLWTAPSLDIQANVLLGDLATLLGADFQPPIPDLQPPATLTVTLVWRAEAETAISYRVFLHLTGPDGQIVAQSDGEPANWTRPTTGWLPGEIVLDERILDIPARVPAGEYVLSCGLYDLATNARLSAADGADAVSLATLHAETP